MARLYLQTTKVLQADLIVAADSVHSKAVDHVLGEEEIQAGNTG
jgi:salicylate hydroxylase